MPEDTPPHNRFFEDGEEPPARYDLDDELDYILNADFESRPREWLAIARKNYRSFFRRSIVISFGYVFLWLMSGMGSGLFVFPLEPVVLAAMTLKATEHLTGQAQSRTRRLYAREYFPLVLYNLGLLFCIALFGAVWITAWDANECWFGDFAPLYVSISMILLGLVLFALNCRLFRFVPYFVVDQKLGLLQAMRGSWRMWRGKFWAFLGMEILSFAVQLLGFLCLGIGLVFVKPFTTLFWTAAYLDSVREPSDNPSLN